MIYLVIAIPLTQGLRPRVIFASKDPEKTSKKRDDLTLYSRDDIFFYVVEEIEIQ